MPTKHDTGQEKLSTIPTLLCDICNHYSYLFMFMRCYTMYLVQRSCKIFLQSFVGSMILPAQPQSITGNELSFLPNHAAVNIKKAGHKRPASRFVILRALLPFSNRCQAEKPRAEKQNCARLWNTGRTTGTR